MKIRNLLKPRKLNLSLRSDTDTDPAPVAGVSTLSFPARFWPEKSIPTWKNPAQKGRYTDQTIWSVSYTHLLPIFFNRNNRKTREIFIQVNRHFLRNNRNRQSIPVSVNFFPLSVFVKIQVKTVRQNHVILISFPKFLFNLNVRNPYS